MPDVEDRCRTAKLLTRRSRVRIASIFFGSKPIPLRGPGIEYLDFREYMEGDDIRFVDWRITARTITPEGDYRLIVKEFLAERMVNNTIILDYSGSMNYGDKLYSAIYTVSGLLWLAYSLNDTIDLVILMGNRVYLQSSVEPVKALILLEKHVCHVDPRGYTSLKDVVNVLKKLKKRRSIFLVSDYGHEPSELIMLSKSIYARKQSLNIINITTPIEYQPPDSRGFYYFRDYETGEGVKTDVETYYRLVWKHMLLYDTYTRKYCYSSMKIKSLDDAVAKTGRLIRLYLGARARVGSLWEGSLPR